MFFYLKPHDTFHAFSFFRLANSIAAGLCGLFSKKKSEEDSAPAADKNEDTGVEAGARIGKKNRGDFRYSFYLPPDREDRDELVVDDACGNPLFVTMNGDGTPTVRDLGGNVLDVEVGADRMVAVYNTEPLSTTRTRAPPSAAGAPAPAPAPAATETTTEGNTAQ